MIRYPARKTVRGLLFASIRARVHCSYEQWYLWPSVCIRGHLCAMKRSELTISVLLIPLDYCAVLAAAALAYSIRFVSLAEALQITAVLPFPAFLRVAGMLAAGWVGILALAGCYTAAARRKWTSEIVRIFLGSTSAFAFILAVIVFSREFFASRFVILAGWFLAIALLLAARLIVRIIERALFTAGIGVHRIVLIGTGRAADALVAAFADRPSLGFRIVRCIPLFTDADAAALALAWKRQEIDEIIDASTPPNLEVLHQLLEFCALHHLPVRYAADVLATHAPRVQLEVFAGIPLVEVSRTRLLGWGRVFKRAGDIIVAAILLVLTSPIMLLVALAVMLDSRGSIFFRQQRVGQAGRPFAFLKFRSMRAGAHGEWTALRAQSDRQGPVPKIKDDPRVTRVGRFLRRWSLDELPQLLNVIAGTMSLVGPRPHLPEEVADYAERHRMVLAVKPGITGLAQVSGRADLDFEEEVQLDTHYVERWSPLLDLAILLRTPFAVVRKRGAY